eukprot:scaffold21387_cov90-Isochrysis_galbana.AAC.1
MQPCHVYRVEQRGHRNRYVEVDVNLLDDIIISGRHPGQKGAKGGAVRGHPHEGLAGASDVWNERGGAGGEEVVENVGGLDQVVLALRKRQ